MSKDNIAIAATTRTAQGKSDVKRLRKQGLLPGVVYGSGEAAKSIQLNTHDFELMLSRYASENIMLDLNMDSGKSHKVLLREVQRHPVTSKPLHADFNEISLTKKIKIEISLNFAGTPTGVSQGGGTLDAHIRSIEVECLPQDIIEQFDVEVSMLDIGDHLSVKDVPLDTSKYTLMSDPEISIASVAPPRVAEEEEEAAEGEEGEEGAASAEPEVITEKKEEEPES